MQALEEEAGDLRGAGEEKMPVGMVWKSVYQEERNHKPLPDGNGARKPGTPPRCLR